MVKQIQRDPLDNRPPHPCTGQVTGSSIAVKHPYAIPIWGGILTTLGEVGASLTARLVTPQGSRYVIGTIISPTLPCWAAADCDGELLALISGTGFAPSGGVYFTQVPTLLSYRGTLGSSVKIVTGRFNSMGAGTQSTLPVYNLVRLFRLYGGLVRWPSFAPGAFSFDTPFANTTLTPAAENAAASNEWVQVFQSLMTAPLSKDESIAVKRKIP
ncbi:MAG: hypothetical protein AAGG51_02830 [Cyanobacteria bacterium P01_G01_bin.54]